MKKKSTHQTQLLIPCMSPRETRTIVDLWPTTGNVSIQKFFLLMIDVFAMYTGNKWADTLVFRILCTNFKTDDVHLISLLGPEFQLSWLVT